MRRNLPIQSWKLIRRLLKLFPNFTPYNVELWPCNQRCVQHCAGGGRTIFFSSGAPTK